MASELTPAVWEGPYVAELPDMSLIYPGEEHLVTEEDLKSGHWRPVDGANVTPEPQAEAEPEPAAEPEAAPSTSPWPGGNV